MDRVRVGPVKGLRIAIAAFVLSVFLFVAAIVGGVYIATNLGTSSKDFSSELRNGLVESCETNGNPLREAVQSILHEQIRRSRATPPRFFPDIPPAVFERLVGEQVRANRAAIRRIAPVACASLYPKP